MDVVIEVPERGKAVQFGRYNQGGAMDIFASEELSGINSDLKKFTVGDSDILYNSESTMDGVKKTDDSLDVSEKVSNLDGMKKKNSTSDWTEPEHLDRRDHAVLKEINRLYKAKKYEEAMNRAMDADTIIREEIPPEIWKRMGGQLTKTGEEKLRERKGNLQEKVNQPKKKKPTLVFNGTIRVLKGVIEREWDLELTDADYIEILDIAQEQSNNFLEVTNEIDPNLTAFLTQMAEALKVWDKKEGKTKEKFDPRFYAGRKDDDNPSFIFSLTSNQLLSEAIKGDFDLVYLVRRELANRGLDSNGRWVGFNEAKRIHRI